MGRRNADGSLVLKKVLSSGRDGHGLKNGGKLSHYSVLRYDFIYLFIYLLLNADKVCIKGLGTTCALSQKSIRKSYNY